MSNTKTEQGAIEQALALLASCVAREGFYSAAKHLPKIAAARTKLATLRAKVEQQAAEIARLARLVDHAEAVTEPQLALFLAALETIAGHGCADPSAYAADVLNRAARAKAQP